MDYYDSYRDHPHPYGRHDDHRVPDDIDGPPPAGFFGPPGPPPPHTFGPMAPTTFGPGRDREYYPHSPERRHSSIEDFIPGGVFPRMDPPTGYSDFGPDYDRARPPYAPEYDPRPGPDYGPPGYGHPDYDRRPPPPPPGYAGYGEYDRRGGGHPDYDMRGGPPRPDYDMRGGPPPPDYDMRGGPPHPDYDMRGGPPPPDYDMRGGPPPGFGHPADYDMRGGPPPPGYDRRGPPPEGYPTRGPMFDHDPPRHHPSPHGPVFGPEPPRHHPSPHGPGFDPEPPRHHPSPHGPGFDPEPPRHHPSPHGPGFDPEPPRHHPSPHGPGFDPEPPRHHPSPHGPVFDPEPPRHHPSPHGPRFDQEPPRFDAAAGRPPPPYEPEPQHAPPPQARQKSPKRGPPPDEGVFPPMPYEPEVANRDAPPPAAVAVHIREPEPEPLHFPPLPYEPGAGSPAHSHVHQHAGDGARGLADYPPEPGPPRGDDRAVPYMPDMGVPPPFPDAHYGQATEHGHVKRKRFEGCKDYWAGFLFLLHFWGVVGVCIWLGVRGIMKTNSNEHLLREATFMASIAPSQYSVPSRLYSIKHWAPQLATAAASGWVFAFLWQWLVRTETMIKVCLSLGAVSTGLLGIILVSTGTAKGLVGLIFLVAALFQGLYVHLVRHRIPFAAIMLNKTRGVVKRHKSLHLISMWTVFVAMFWLGLWIFGVSGAVSLPYGGWYAALLVLSLAWSMEVLRNIVYVTVSSVVGQHYYEGNELEHFPVTRAYKRAWTLSFGSVCLGSMFVAPVQGLHSMAKRLANEQGANEFLFSCVNCFLGVMEFFNRHFNKWAFVEVGLHGKSFVKSARQTWQMLKEQDAMLLINDDLTGAILLTSCIIGGVLTALVGGCWTFATYRYLTVGVSILSFFIGFFVTYLTLVVPESAVATYYVCFAEDPGTLKKQDEPLYQYMAERKQKLDQEIE